MFPLKNTEAYIHANGFRSTLGKELSDRDAAISELGSEIQALTNYTLETGVKNFLDVTATTTTDHGVTFTVNADKTITVSGTADGLAAIDVSKNVPLKPDNYILSGNGATNIVWNSLAIYNGSTLVETFDLSSVTDSDIPLILASKTFDNVTLSVKRKTNGAVSGTISPMIRLASITDPTYQPYAKTNVELTADVEQLNVTISDASSERDFFEKLITKLHNDITVTQKVYLGYALYLNNNSYSFEFIKLTDTLSRLEAYQSSRLIVAQNNNGTLLVKTVILTDMT